MTRINEENLSQDKIHVENTMRAKIFILYRRSHNIIMKLIKGKVSTFQNNMQGNGIGVRLREALIKPGPNMLN